MKSSSSTGRLLSLLTLALSLPTVLGARLKVEDFESPALARRYNSGKPRQAAKRATTSTCSAEDTTTSSGSEINTSTKELWQPAVGTAWQIVLQNPLALPASGKKFSPNVPVWDIDLFTNDADVFSALKAENKKIICYFSAGSYEPYRSDSSSFKSSDMGSSLDGWEDEKWLKLSSSNVRAIMKKRIQLAASKGCDAIDPDNVDGYNNENGLGLTKQDSIDFIKYLVSVANPLGLSVGLKNAGEIIDDVVDSVQFSVNEECVEFTECATFSTFIDNKKPVFHIEYPGTSGISYDTICSTKGDAAGSTNFSKAIKNMDLDGWVRYCSGKHYRTAMDTS